MIELPSDFPSLEQLKEHAGSAFKDIFEDNVYGLTKEDASGSCLLDIGANIGLFSIAAAALGAKEVLAIEPDLCAFVEVSLPYQKARRTANTVWAISEGKMKSIFRSGEWAMVGEYHSHPFESHEKVEPLEPSTVDLKEWANGHLEIIVRVCRTRKAQQYCRELPCGAVEIAFSRFSFLLKAFLLNNKRKNEYRTVRISLDSFETALI